MTDRHCALVTALVDADLTYDPYEEYGPRPISRHDFIRQFVGGKRCGKCRQIKPLREFYRSADPQHLAGVRWACKACDTASQRERRAQRMAAA